MGKMYFLKKAFTLIELMAVIIIIGIVAAYAIPNYTVSMERAHVRDATSQLISIWSANQIYRAQNGRYWPTTNGNDLTAINTTLSLGIIPNGMTYSCNGGGAAPGTFTCTAVRSTGAVYTLTVTEATINAPPVTGTTNPSCAPTGTALCPP